MFQEKEIKAYQNLKAPDSIYNRVQESVLSQSIDEKAHENKIIRMRVIRVISTIAACLILVVGIGFMNRNDSVKIVLNGQNLETKVLFYDISPASDLRSSPIFSVPLELDIHAETKLSVSYGMMRFSEDEVTVNKTVNQPVTLWWELPRSSEEIPECEMVLEDKNGVIKITLTYNSADKTITATKRK